MVLHEMADVMRQPQAIVHAAPEVVDPSQLYAAPSDLMLDHQLSGADKIALLSIWRDDLTLRLTARAEGMDGSDEGLADALARVRAALGRLQRATRRPQPDSPTSRPKDGPDAFRAPPMPLAGRRNAPALAPESCVFNHPRGGPR